jgi:hypothetical protein
MEAVVERRNLQLAYQRVVSNKGAAGVDDITVRELKDHLKQHWPAIRAKLPAGAYVPLPVRRMDIVKPEGGQRMLGIPTVVDRLIQQALHQVLSSIFECLCSIACSASSAFHEPPYAEPHVRWCGRTARVTAPPTRYARAGLDYHFA